MWIVDGKNGVIVALICKSGVEVTPEMDLLPKESASGMMDMDLEGASCALTPLKRYNSAPFINVSVAEQRNTCDSPTPVQSSSPRPGTVLGTMSVHIPVSDKVTRRFSTSSVMLHSPSGLTKMPSRLDQIRLEESVTQRDREAAHEREVQSKMMMSQSWDELTLDDNEPMVADSKRPRSFNEPLHIFTNSCPVVAGSISPTRVGKQCFSPSLQQSLKNGSFTPSPSPSPTRKTTTFISRRSLSPIVLRPSPLSGVKRRVESESTELSDNYFSTPKRFRPSNSPGGGFSSNADMQYQRLELRVSSSSVSCSSNDEGTSCDEHDVAPVNEYEHSNFAISRPSPMAASVATGMSPSSFVFQCATTRDSVESQGISESSTSVTALDGASSGHESLPDLGDSSSL